MLDIVGFGGTWRNAPRSIGATSAGRSPSSGQWPARSDCWRWRLPSFAGFHDLRRRAPLDRLVRIAAQLGHVAAGSPEADRAIHAALKVGLVIGRHVLLSILNDRRNTPSGQHFGEIAGLADVEHDDRNIIVAA